MNEILTLYLHREAKTDRFRKAYSGVYYTIVRGALVPNKDYPKLLVNVL